MSSSTLSPFAKVKRFSTSHEKHPMPPNEDGESVPNPKRSSRLNDFMSRSRTASLPPRPHTGNGSTSKQKLATRLGTFKGKGKEMVALTGASSVLALAKGLVDSIQLRMVRHTNLDMGQSKCFFEGGPTLQLTVR